MSAKRTELRNSHRKATDLGIIDSWLRGVAAMVPEAAAVFDRHTLSFSAFDSISHGDIRRTTGFTSLMDACNRNDMRIDVKDDGKGGLEARLHAGQPFGTSTIFGGKEPSEPLEPGAPV